MVIASFFQAAPTMVYDNLHRFGCNTPSTEKIILKEKVLQLKITKLFFLKEIFFSIEDEKINLKFDVVLNLLFLQRFQLNHL